MPSSENAITLPKSGNGGEPSAIQPQPGVPMPDADQSLPANSWTSAAVSASGPRYLKLSEPRKAYLRKLHHNLGHPTAEKLSKHLAELGAEEQLVQGALAYLCASCAERRPPSLNPPGTLKEARDFNHRIYIDGFDWKGSTGYQGYVVHVIDESTQFHPGRRTVRDGAQAQKVFEECWSSWAGTPSEMVLDCGGEFVADAWKDFLQQESIKTILTAAPWQRGRIERHGGIIKEMLHRIDQAKPIRHDGEFEKALMQFFRAKSNNLSSNCGFSPEQAVLGKATKLPASITGDESTSAHLHAALNEGPEAEKFRASLERRMLAREAFVENDNSQAIRRAAEVKYASLNAAEKKLFEEAKTKELSRSDGRELAMEPVAEMKPLLQMSDEEVLMLDGNAYGRVDAPWLFYKEFRRQLERVGFAAHPLDNCL
eukprot:s902_g12.t1